MERSAKPWSSKREPLGSIEPNPKLKLADPCREVIPFRRRSLRTERSYLGLIDSPAPCRLTPQGLSLREIPQPASLAG
jgi:hypothetical protein